MKYVLTIETDEELDCDPDSLQNFFCGMSGGQVSGSLDLKKHDLDPHFLEVYSLHHENIKEKYNRLRQIVEETEKMTFKGTMCFKMYPTDFPYAGWEFPDIEFINNDEEFIYASHAKSYFEKYQKAHAEYRQAVSQCAQDARVSADDVVREFEQRS